MLTAFAGTGGDGKPLDVNHCDHYY
jgi:hypothetical protein